MVLSIDLATQDYDIRILMRTHAERQRQAEVGKHYDGVFFREEASRFEKYHPIEFEITVRQLRKYVPKYSIVADIGVGVGHYAELLAREKQNSLYLIDVSQKLLRSTHSRLKKNGFKNSILGTFHESATDIHSLHDESVDVVLLLGPLYHLCSLSERIQAVKEARRVLKKGGIIFAAGINRIACLRDHFRFKPESISKWKELHTTFLKTGVLEKKHSLYLGHAHFTAPDEFQSLFKKHFRQIEFRGVESFASPVQREFLKMKKRQTEAWVKLIEKTGISPFGRECSDHLLWIGRK